MIEYSVSPALPSGLTIDTTSGQVTGTPVTASMTTSYIVTARNDAGAATFSLSLTVNPLFLLEPQTATTIGAGQVIQGFATLKNRSADPFPSYLDAGLITWTSAQPAIASINSEGVIAGLSAGSTTLTARYQSLSAQMEVRVRGALVTRDVAVSGQGIRSYSIYVPAPGGASGARSAILSLHGGGGSAMIQASTSQLNELADVQQIYIVYLEGTGLIRTFNAGNCCGSAQSQAVDDVAYVAAVLQDAVDDFPIDAQRVFATGFSNGGMMSHRLACALSDRIAGVAPIGGASAQFDGDLNQYYSCNPARRIPVLHMHATNDRNYPYQGGVGAGLSGTNFHSIDSTIADWIVRNNVLAVATVENVTATTTCHRYATPANAAVSSAPVVLCKTDPPDNYDAVNDIVFGGGHSWPGGVRSPAANSDVPIADFDANAYMWRFFNQ
ncbi:MAG: putative Ig domain-containing protein [Steroidobacteraceae bacterium]|nr:putative Ig domain-containing protein [Steroidobacteraceae bacterium]